MATAAISDDLAAYDEEELEVKGTLTYRPAVEMLPKTRRTEEAQRKKIEMLREKKQKAEDLRRQKEQEEAQRRLKEQEAKKLKAQQEQKRKEEERRKREEEEQRKKMEGGLDQILDALSKNQSAPHIALCGIDVSSVRLRLLTQALEKNLSCQSIDLSRKGLNDEDGVSIAGMLKKNGQKKGVETPEGQTSVGEGLEKIECEGNSLGVKTASSIAESLGSNDTLRCLNLEGNNLTASGNDQTGVIALAHALRGNKSLRVLLLGKNHITQQGGEHFVRAIEQNNTITMLDLSGNELGVEQLRRIDEVVKRNREKLSGLRRAERRERFTLYNEEFKCRQHNMQVEAARLELEAREERRLNRMKAKFEEWREMCEEEGKKEAEDLQLLTTEAEERAAGGKKKGKKGKKKK